VYSVPVSVLPGGRGDGQPVSTLVDIESGGAIGHYFAGPATAKLLLCSSGGYGFVASVDNLTTRLKAGKAFVACAEGETLCRPAVVVNPGANSPTASPAAGGVAATHVAAVSTLGRILTFELAELKEMASGGRGLMLMDLEAKDTLAGAAAYTRSIRVMGVGRGGKERDESFEIRSLNNAKASRGRKGKVGDFGFKPTAVVRLE
jgi:topoisomerase IV subunit A